MSTDKKLTRRRDTDPVRVYADRRLAYWTGGRPGLGKREWERLGTRENAEARAARLRELLRRGLDRTAPKADATLDEMVQDALDTLRAESAPEGTVRQYKSEWNAHVPADIGAVRCAETAIWHYTRVFSSLVQGKASEQVVKNVARTLGHLIQFGVDHGYFDDHEPFGTPTQRKGLVRKYRKKAAAAQAEGAKRITLDVCPTVSDVEEYATAFEMEYPGYGARLVRLAFATGLRFCELLALRWDSIDLQRQEVRVDWQLDRYGVWPALVRPKGGKPRTAHLWGCYSDVAASLIADALAREGEEHGWLFPRHRSVKKWADQAGRLAGAARKSCDWSWSFHWLRHAHASWGLAAKTDGGYGFSPKRVQKWLGHARLSTTTDTYVHEPREDDDHVRKETHRPPGTKAA